MSTIYQDPTKPIPDRVADLLDRMTIEEKTAQLGAIWFNAFLGDDGFDDDRAAELLVNGIGQITRIGASTALRPEESAAIVNQLQRIAIETTRLGIPIVIHEEAVAGYSARGATVFPQAIGLAATFDPDLIAAAATVMREQMLAVGARHNLSPVLDVARDPRWGRLEETYGESPELCGVLGTAYVRAMQNEQDGTLRRGVVCTGKHFLGYSMSVGGRNHAPVQLGPNELREVYAEPFAAAIRDAGLASIMNSYSAIDGVPCASNPAILTGLLRDELGFDGTVVADYWAVTQLRNNHKTAADESAAAAQALFAGLDVELPALDFYRSVPELVASGALPESVVDTSVERVLAQKFALGLFDQPYVDEGSVTAVFDTPAQRALARRAASESIILLTNDGTLPLDPSALRRVAVVGPAADDRRLLQGDYHYPAHQEISMGDAVDMLPTADTGALTPGHHYTEHVTPLAGLRRALDDVEVVHARGCGITEADGPADIEDAVRAATGADVAIVCVGGRSGLTLDATVGEGRDARDLDLTGDQQDLVERVAATGVPTVVVVLSGRAHTLGPVLPHASALVHAWCPGEEGGSGLADVLTGAVDASGRLPVTLVEHVGQIPLHHDQRARAHEAAFHGGYVDGGVEPLFPFGHGCSYTTFEFDDLTVVASTTSSPVVVGVTATNTGPRAGTAVPQLYFSDRVASTIRPRRQLAGFARVELDSGEARRVTWTVDASKLALIDTTRRWTTEPGAFTFGVRSSSATEGPEETVVLDGDPVHLLQRDIVATTVEIAATP